MGRKKVRRRLQILHTLMKFWFKRLREIDSRLTLKIWRQVSWLRGKQTTWRHNKKSLRNNKRLMQWNKKLRKRRRKIGRDMKLSRNLKRKWKEPIMIKLRQWNKYKLLSWRRESKNIKRRCTLMSKDTKTLAVKRNKNRGNTMRGWISCMWIMIR